MPRLVAAIVLALRFLRAVVVAGLQTVRVIARSRRGGAGVPETAFVRVRYAPMSAQGAALLGCMVTLTPGTTTIDIDSERCELVLHVLDASSVDAVIESIRRDFEPGLATLFGEGR